MYRKKERNLNDYLEDIIDEIKNIESFVHMMEMHNSPGNEIAMKAMATRAVTKSLEMIAEATKKIPKNIKDNYTSIPWKDITNMRNITVHEYFAIDAEAIWKTTKNDLDPLKTVICDIMDKIKTGHLRVLVGKDVSESLVSAIRTCDPALTRMLLNVHRQGDIKNILKTKDSNGYTLLDLAKKLEFSEQSSARKNGYQKIIRYLEDAEAGKEVGADLAGSQPTPNKDTDKKDDSPGPGEKPTV